MRRTYRRRRLVALLALGAAAFGAVRLAPAAGGLLGGGEGAEAASYRGAVPVLMYHVISTPQPGVPNAELWVKPTDFSSQMDWLAKHGYDAITLKAAYDAWSGGAGMPDKPVVVSFDDGYRSHFTEALPTLAKHDWPGVLNLKVDTLDQAELDRRQVGAMAAAGWEVDSHTINHLDVSRLSGAGLTREVSGSKRILERRLGVPIDFFCYPAGRFDPAAVRAVKAAGYLGATSTRPGLARPSQLWALRRIRVGHDDHLAGFAAEMRRWAPGTGKGGPSAS